jgi:hypothetical protein
MARAIVALGLACRGSQASPARVSGPTGLSANGQTQGSKAQGGSTVAALVGFRQAGDEVGRGRWLWHQGRRQLDLRHRGGWELIEIAPPWRQGPVGGELVGLAHVGG